jgi:hypothetical protein
MTVNRNIGRITRALDYALKAESRAYYGPIKTIAVQQRMDNNMVSDLSNVKEDPTLFTVGYHKCGSKYKVAQ